jgi:hypothetical protein
VEGSISEPKLSGDVGIAKRVESAYLDQLLGYIEDLVRRVSPVFLYLFHSAHSHRSLGHYLGYHLTSTY